MSQKLKAVVIYGGQSTEHEVSRRSAAFIWKHLDRNRFDVYAIAIDKHGRWQPQNRQQIPSTGIKEMPLEDAQQADAASRQLVNDIWTPGFDHSQLVVFNIIHGTTGEDGMLQGFFDLQGIAHVGPGLLGSAASMDKVVAKQLVAAVGIAIVPYLAFRHFEWLESKARLLEEALDRLEFPMFVKPASLGSSVGIRRVKDRDSLAAAIQHAFEFDERVLIESGVEAREIEFACLGGYGPRVSGPGEVAAAEGFYSYEEKYSNASKAEVLVPAPLAQNLIDEGREITRKAFYALNLYGMSRIDLFLRKSDNKYFFNEANTLPGMTAISQYPKLWEHEGVQGMELISTLLDSALERRAQQKKLRRTI